MKKDDILSKPDEHLRLVFTYVGIGDGIGIGVITQSEQKISENRIVRSGVRSLDIKLR